MAQWITRLPTEQKIPGSTPGRLGMFFGPHSQHTPEYKSEKSLKSLIND